MNALAVHMPFIKSCIVIFSIILQIDRSLLRRVRGQAGTLRAIKRCLISALLKGTTARQSKPCSVSVSCAPSCPDVEVEAVSVSSPTTESRIRKQQRVSRERRAACGSAPFSSQIQEQEQQRQQCALQTRQVRNNTGALPIFCFVGINMDKCINWLFVNR